MVQTQILKIFLASPSDVKTEIEMIFGLKNDLDNMIGKPNNIRFEFVNWKTNSYPGAGIDAQDLINKEINDDYNVFLGIFWLQFGSPTSRAESGTINEYNKALVKFRDDSINNYMMLYFKTSTPTNIYELDATQFAKVKEFKEKTKIDGILY